MKVRHLLDLVCHDIGYDAVKAKVVKPLHGLKVAAYYGCQVVRPDYDSRWDSHEHPTSMDKLLAALGAEPVDWSLKTQCCGGHMSVIGPDVAFGLIRRLIHGAQEAGADLVVTLCPMCQLNLDAYQVEMNKHFHTDYQVPVLYFTQLMGLAFGKKAKDLGIGKEFVDRRAGPGQDPGRGAQGGGSQAQAPAQAGGCAAHAGDGVSHGHVPMIASASVTPLCKRGAGGIGPPLAAIPGFRARVPRPLRDKSPPTPLLQRGEYPGVRGLRNEVRYGI
jgi:hypothetical protein